MEIVNQLAGRASTRGLLSAARVYNDTDDPWIDGDRRIDWRQGVQVRLSGCSGVHIHPVGCVPECCAPDPAGVCFDPAPGFEMFKPFRLSKALCVSGGCEPGLLDALRADFTASYGPALAKALHVGVGDNPSLQSEATNLSSTAGATSIAEGLGTLMRNRGVVGLNGGWLHVPAYAAPSLAPVLADMQTAFGGAFDRVVMDYGYPTSGPGGVAAPAGHAWLYVSGPVVAAISTNWLTPDSTWLRDDGSGCFRPIADKAAIVAWHTCGTFAVLVDLRQKGC